MSTSPRQQSKPDSMEHVFEQPSPSLVFPSSQPQSGLHSCEHSSVSAQHPESSCRPSPHKTEQVSASLSVAPEHCHPLSTVQFAEQPAGENSISVRDLTWARHATASARTCLPWSQHTPSPVTVLPSSHSSNCKRYPLPQASTYTSSTHVPAHARMAFSLSIHSCVRQPSARKAASKATGHAPSPHVSRSASPWHANPSSSPPRQK